MECENNHVGNESVGLEDATQSENNASSTNLKGPRRSSRMRKALICDLSIDMEQCLICDFVLDLYYLYSSF